MISTFFVLSLSAVFYTIDFSYKLSAMEKDAVYHTKIEQYKTLLEERNRSALNHQDRAKLLHQQLTDSRGLYAQLQRQKSEMQAKHKIQIEEYKSIFKQHYADLNEALGRKKVLRGNKKDKSSALEMAWLRMDELMEENNELSHHLNEANKQQLMVLRDQQLIKTVESLTHQLKAVSEEKENDAMKFAARDAELTSTVGDLTQRLEALSEEKYKLNILSEELEASLIQIKSEYEQLEFVHTQITDLFLAPILSYKASNLLHRNNTQ